MSFVLPREKFWAKDVSNVTKCAESVFRNEEKNDQVAAKERMITRQKAKYVSSLTCQKIAKEL